MLARVSLFFWLIKTSATNVALNKPTYASTTFPAHRISSDPGKAVDGNHDDNWYNNSCSATAHEDMNPWWMIDLLDDYTIHNITIRNRGDDYSERFHDLKIEVFMTNPVRCPQAVGQLCLQYDGQFGSLETLTCDSTVTGRFLKLYKFDMVDGLDILTICELEVEASTPSKKEYTWARYPRNTGVKFTQVSARTTNTKPRNDCATACLRNPSCVGFNYGRETESCQMISQPMAADIKGTDADFDYYGYDLC